ncbi:MAG: ChaB family protein [Methanoregulaceae archaeon]|nr:ChaB family protein [Methanoregulaceae archaeon]
MKWSESPTFFSEHRVAWAAVKNEYGKDKETGEWKKR